eukprot:m.88397 g.88397  ORF g.88397 m.88397 type:complete len:151 (+) comp11639_c0_seq2:133-585(+)
MWGDGKKGSEGVQGRKKQLRERLILDLDSGSCGNGNKLEPETLRPDVSVGSTIGETRFRRTKNLIGMLSKKALGQKSCDGDEYSLEEIDARPAGRSSPFSLRRGSGSKKAEHRRNASEQLLDKNPPQGGDLGSIAHPTRHHLSTLNGVPY